MSFTNTQIPHTFTTKRLRAEKVTEKYINYLAEILYNDKVQESYNTTDKSSFTNIKEQLKIIESQWRDYNFGLYIIFDKLNSEFIGFAGFHAIEISENKNINALTSKNKNELEIYGLLMPQHWRKGYGYEIFNKLINLGFKYLPYSNIVAYIEPKNVASLKLMRKLYFKEEKSVMYNDKLHALFRLKKTI